MPAAAAAVAFLPVQVLCHSWLSSYKATARSRLPKGRLRWSRRHLAASQTSQWSRVSDEDMVPRTDPCSLPEATVGNEDIVQAAAQRLLDAAFRGVLEEVIHLVEADAPGAAEWWGHSLLHAAAHAGDVDAARTLLATDTDLAADRRGYTALHVAAAAGHAEVVEVLLAGCVDASPASREGLTPMHCAAAAGHAHVVRALAAAGADVRAVNQAGDIPLHSAARWGRLEVVRVLVEAGAPAGALNPTTGKTPADEAASKCHLEVAEFLLRCSSPQGV